MLETRYSFPGRVPLNTYIPGRALPDAWCYGVSATTCWSRVSILWLDEITSLISNFCFSVAAWRIVLANIYLRCILPVDWALSKKKIATYCNWFFRHCAFVQYDYEWPVSNPFIKTAFVVGYCRLLWVHERHPKAEGTIQFGAVSNTPDTCGSQCAGPHYGACQLCHCHCW